MSRFAISMIIIGVLMAGCSIVSALGIVYTGGIKVPPYSDEPAPPAEVFTPSDPAPSSTTPTGGAPGDPPADRSAPQPDEISVPRTDEPDAPG